MKTLKSIYNWTLWLVVGVPVLSFIFVCCLIGALVEKISPAKQRDIRSAYLDR